MREKNMARKKKKTGGALPQIKKEIKDFLMDEEGKISKKDIAKLGVSLAILGFMLQPEIALAQHTNTCTGHISSFAANGHLSTCVHTNTHANHSNHGSHGSHGSGGWC